jgi:endoglucanase
MSGGFKRLKFSEISLSICVLFFLYPYINAFGQIDSSVVNINGQLKVEGNHIVNKYGNPVALHGMSLFWSQWMGKYYNYDCVKWLRDDWKCTVVRAAMGIESGGYLTNPESEKAHIISVVNACIDLGIYVIIDWHDHNAQNHEEEAIQFFAEMATKYGEKPNVIYEIYNEPEQVSWSSLIKPYAETVIDTIRSIDPDNLIVVGTPTWSQRVDIASTDTLAYNNIVYALHFYAATHKQTVRNNAITALDNGIALFVTEWGTCNNLAQGDIDSISVEAWCNFMDQNMISWCNWSIADKVETASALLPGASATGGWSKNDLTESGTLVRNKIIEWYKKQVTAIDDQFNEKIVSDLRLYQNYPNPFNPITTVKYTLGTNFFLHPQYVDLSVYNILGQKITTLVSEKQAAGIYSVKWNATGIPSGIYLYVLKSHNFNNMKKMILVR